jgi:1,4-dihydroxy-2-naphthoate octaprenyltransferase
VTVRLEGHVLALLDVMLAMTAALLAHAAVNLFNEHHDFVSGLDAVTARTPFSGGSGSLQDFPEAAPMVHRTASACLLGVVLIGSWFLWRSGPWLLAYGLVGVLLVVGYTGVLTRRPLLCLLAPGLGFGVLMVAGTFHALAGEFSWLALLVSLPPTLMASALLLLNQIPDIEADRGAGRQHLAIQLGPYRSAVLAVAMVWLAFVLVALAVWAGTLPASALCMWLVLPLLVTWLMRLRDFKASPGRGTLLPLLGLNVVILLSSLALLNIGLWLAV